MIVFSFVLYIVSIYECVNYVNHLFLLIFLYIGNKICKDLKFYGIYSISQFQGSLFSDYLNETIIFIKFSSNLILIEVFF